MCVRLWVCWNFLRNCWLSASLPTIFEPLLLLRAPLFHTHLMVSAMARTWDHRKVGFCQEHSLFWLLIFSFFLDVLATRHAICSRYERMYTRMWRRLSCLPTRLWRSTPFIRGYKTYEDVGNAQLIMSDLCIFSSVKKNSLIGYIYNHVAKDQYFKKLGIWDRLKYTQWRKGNMTYME